MDAEGSSLIGTALAVAVKGASTSNMFEAAVSKFVKTCGKESLVAAPSLDEADRCRPFQVVVKKNRRWFWQSPKYEVTPFQLNQLLTKPDKFDQIKVTSRTLTTYNKMYEFDANGKIGGKLVSLFDLEISGSDTINVSAKFGEVIKEEVDQPDFMAELSSRSLNLDHEFVKQVRANPRKTLCVVVGTALVDSEANVHMKVNRKGEEKEDAAGLPEKITSEDEDVAIGDAVDKTLGIPKGTPLAFNLVELAVKGNGTLELMVERNSLGGFEETGDSVDGGFNEGILEGMSLEEQYGAITTLPKDVRGQLTAAVLDICLTPADISTLLIMLKDGQRSVGSDPVKEGHLEVMGKVEASTKVLEVAGFKVKEDLTVTYPTEATPLLDTVRSLFEAIIELDDCETVALSACNTNYAKPLLHLLSSALDQDVVHTSDSKLSVLFSAPNPGQTFTQTLGFQVTDAGKLVPADDNLNELEGAYRAVYALWWHAGMDKAPGSTWRCDIL